jgi:hypothetical protein
MRSREKIARPPENMRRPSLIRTHSHHSDNTSPVEGATSQPAVAHTLLGGTERRALYRSGSKEVETDGVSSTKKALFDGTTVPARGAYAVESLEPNASVNSNGINGVIQAAEIRPPTQLAQTIASDRHDVSYDLIEFVREGRAKGH